MDDILDEIIIQNTNQTYSWISLVSGLISVSCFVYILSRVSRVGIDGQYLIPSLPIVILLIASSLIGVLATLICHVRKEPYYWQRQVGAILNLFLIAIVFGAMLYVIFIER